MKHSPQYHGVYSDLLAYTGLSPAGLKRRHEGREQFHFEGEHAWWDPKSVGELTWFYHSSVSYLFANADHPQESAIVAVVCVCRVPGRTTGRAKPRKDAFSLRSCPRGVPFPRVQVHPRSGLRCHRRRRRVGAHPDYHITAKYLVRLLRRGGLFFESSPFDNASDDPLAIHQRASVVMAEALQGLEFEGPWTSESNVAQDLSRKLFRCFLLSLRVAGRERRACR